MNVSTTERLARIFVLLVFVSVGVLAGVLFVRSRHANSHQAASKSGNASGSGPAKEPALAMPGDNRQEGVGTFQGVFPSSGTSPRAAGN